jgi:hypothetical protein
MSRNCENNLGPRGKGQSRTKASWDRNGRRKMLEGAVKERCEELGGTKWRASGEQVGS